MSHVPAATVGRAGLRQQPMVELVLVASSAATLAREETSVAGDQTMRDGHSGTAVGVGPKSGGLTPGWALLIGAWAVGDVALGVFAFRYGWAGRRSLGLEERGDSHRQPPVCEPGDQATIADSLRRSLRLGEHCLHPVDKSSHIRSCPAEYDDLKVDGEAVRPQPATCAGTKTRDSESDIIFSDAGVMRELESGQAPWRPRGCAGDHGG